MKESYGEGVAIYTGPESCGGDSNVTAEALTGVHAGQVLSREIPYLTSAWVTKVGPENPEGARQGYTDMGSRTAP